MNFKPELLAKVLAGEKTQTRRPVKNGDEIEYFILPDYNTDERSPWIVRRNGRVHYKVGNIYTVCPGRGKAGQGEVRLMRIRQQDARDISINDAKAEGFDHIPGFLEVWCGFYDPKALYIHSGDNKLSVFEYIKRFNSYHQGREMGKWMEMLFTRPDELYQCYALTFELVK